MVDWGSGVSGTRPPRSAWRAVSTCRVGRSTRAFDAGFGGGTVCGRGVWGGDGGGFFDIVVPTAFEVIGCFETIAFRERA